MISAAAACILLTVFRSPHTERVTQHRAGGEPATYRLAWQVGDEITYEVTHTFNTIIVVESTPAQKQVSFTSEVTFTVVSEKGGSVLVSWPEIWFGDRFSKWDSGRIVLDKSGRFAASKEDSSEILWEVLTLMTLPPVGYDPYASKDFSVTYKRGKEQIGSGIGRVYARSAKAGLPSVSSIAIYGRNGANQSFEQHKTFDEESGVVLWGKGENISNGGSTTIRLVRRTHRD